MGATHGATLRAMVQEEKRPWEQGQRGNTLDCGEGSRSRRETGWQETRAGLDPGHLTPLHVPCAPPTTATNLSFHSTSSLFSPFFLSLSLPLPAVSPSSKLPPFLVSSHFPSTYSNNERTEEAEMLELNTLEVRTHQAKILISDNSKSSP